MMGLICGLLLLAIDAKDSEPEPKITVVNIVIRGYKNKYIEITTFDKERNDMKKNLFSLFLLLIALTWTPSASAEQTINNCPIPDNMKIVAPDKSEVPPKLALFSGIWEGNWGSMSVLFIVEKIAKNEADIILSYSGRQTKGMGSIQPAFTRKTCPIEKGEDGNYRITMTTGRVTNRLIQTDDPNSIRVSRDGLGGAQATAGMQDSMFRRKEMK
jgi:hypothetical protein